MAREEELVYVVDTSALVDLPILYPRAVFDGLWTSLEQLIADQRLIAPHEVYRELGKKDDEVFKWVKRHKAMFVDLGAAQQALLREILGAFPNWIDRETDKPVADPLVIALARSGSTPRCVVAHENPGGKGATRIPNVCQQYGIDYVKLAEMSVREGWRF